MSTILNKLKELAAYFNVNRRVGHTTRMLNGAFSISKNGYDATCIVLTHSSDFSNYLNKGTINGNLDKSYTAIPFTSRNYDRVLRGHRSPLLIDNALLQSLFSEAVDELQILSTDVNRYKQDNITLNQFNKKLEDEKKELAQVITKLKCELLDYQEDDVKSTTKSFISPIDILIENKEVKSIEVKIEYHE